MNTPPLIKASLAILFLSGKILLAAQPATIPTTLANNAATDYWKAFELLPDDPTAKKILYSWSDGPLNADTARIISAGQPSLDLLSRGAALAQCDWGCDYAKGWEMLLPQLGKGRALAQLACLRARAEFQQHQFKEAADDLVNIIALAEHLSTDKTMIGSLVRNGIEQLAIKNLTPQLQSLDKPTLAYLAQRLTDLPVGSTLAEIIQTESDLGPGWALGRAQRAAAIGEPIDWGNLHEVLGPAEQAVLAATANTPPDEIASQLQSLRSYFTSVEQLVQSNSDQQQIERTLKILFEQYSSKPLAAIFISNQARSLDTYAANRTSLVMLQAAIVVAKEGPQQAKNFVDPINHQPLEYHAIPAGFDLVSTVLNRGQRVRLRVSVTPIQ
jgi:hypothetical protein